MTYQELTSEELYIRLMGLLFGLLAAIIWIFSSLKAEIIPDFIKIQVPSSIGILSFVVFILIVVTLIYDFIRRLLLRFILTATAGIVYNLRVRYSAYPKLYKFLFTTISVIVIIFILDLFIIEPDSYWKVSIGLVITYFIMIAAKIAGECLVPDKDDKSDK